MHKILVNLILEKFYFSNIVMQHIKFKQQNNTEILYLQFITYQP